MSVNSSRSSLPRRIASDYRNVALVTLAGVVMILLARFLLDGVIAGMFGVWGISVIAVGIGGHLLLRLWGAYNQ